MPVSTREPNAIRDAEVLVITGPQQLEYLNVDLPALGPDDVLVRTLASGISHGTEMNVYRGVAPQWSKTYNRDLRLFQPVAQADNPIPERGYFTGGDALWGYPLAYGYANVGRVVEVGTNVTSVAAGSLVYAYRPHQTAYVAPATSVILLPDLTDPAQGVFFANLNTAYNGVLDADIRIDDTVVVFGQGVVGSLVMQLLKRTSAGCVIAVDTLETRRCLARRLGADEVLSPLTEDVAVAVRERTHGIGADVVIEVSGSYPALQEAIRTAAPNTTVIAMSWYGGTGEALALSDEFHHNRIMIKSSQVGGIAPDLGATHSLERRAHHVLDSFNYLNLDALISNRIPFSEASDGYRLVESRDERVTQVVLTYGD